MSPGVSQVSLRCLLVSFSVIGASSFPPGGSFAKVTDATRYTPDLPRLHRILLIPNVHFFTFFPDVDIKIRGNIDKSFFNSLNKIFICLVILTIYDCLKI